MLFALGFVFMFTIGGLLNHLALPTLFFLSYMLALHINKALLYIEVRLRTLRAIRTEVCRRKKVLKTTICWDLLTIILLGIFFFPVKMYNFEQSAGNQQTLFFNNVLVGTSETKRGPHNLL